MSYQVLARKWRPRSFKEMIGQAPILRMLKNALDNQRLHHAYLFTGTRGVGKTTIARIFAKSLNCEQGISATPCGECNSCQAIDAGRFIDLIEIDAASRTKVEDTRELLDNVHYSPQQGRFKVYLIDEVHMLSGHSFNALLKTLEEPPAHVKFLLATTDPKRLPITILSRCLQFNLRRVSEEHIAQHLATICTAEHIEFESGALQHIANVADGSLRDALSLLDQAIAFCQNKLTATEVKQMLGHIEQNFIFCLLQALAEQQGAALYAELQRLAELAPDYTQVLSQLLATLHQMAVIQLVPNQSNPSNEIIQLAQQISPEETQLYYQIALIGKNNLPMTARPAEGFEMTMLRMLAFKPTAVSTVTIAKESPAIIKPALMTKPPETSSHWPELLTNLKLSGITQALASNCSLISLQQDKIELALASQHEPLLNKRATDRIEQALAEHLKRPIKLEIKITADDIQTPAKKQHYKMAEQQAKATETIKSDARVQKILDVFDATLDLDSIKSID